MKKKIRFVDNIDNKITEKEIEVRELGHFNAQLRFPHLVQRPKKGKGSFKRRSKYPSDIDI